MVGLSSTSERKCNKHLHVIRDLFPSDCAPWKQFYILTNEENYVYELSSFLYILFLLY